MKTPARFAFLIIGTFFWQTFSFSASQDGSAIRLSLTDAMRLADEQNLDLFVASERVKQASARKWQASSFLLPQVSADISQKRQTRDLSSQGINIPGLPDPVVGPFNSFDARLHVTQMIFDAASIAKLFSFKDLERLSEAQHRKVRQDVMAVAATLYVDAERAEDRTRLSEAFVKLSLKALWIAHRQWRFGQGTLISVKEAKVSYREYQSKLKAARTDECEKRFDLLMALGLGLDREIVFAHEKTLSEYRIPSEKELGEFLKAHPEIEVEKRTLEEKEAEVRVPWAEYLPKFSVMADYGYSGQEPDRSNRTYTVGAQGSMPLFDGLQKVHRISEAESQVKESRAVLKDKGTRVEAKARVAEDAVVQTLDMLKAKDLKFFTANQKKDLAEKRFKIGSGSEWELYSSEVGLALAADERNEAIAAYLLARVNLAHALGNMETLIERGKK